jgi:hypothetical protein
VSTVVEDIATEIVRRLRNITVLNGYTFDVSNVVRPDRLGQNIVPENQLIVLSQGDSTKVDELSYPGNPPAVAYETIFSIHCFYRDSDKNPSEFDPVVNDLAGQVIKCLRHEAGDRIRWMTMAEKAIDSDIRSITPYPESDGTHIGVTIPLAVTYRHSEGNPYEVRA